MRQDLLIASLVVTLTCCLTSLAVAEPVVYFKDTFDDANWSDRWVHSNWHADDGARGTWRVSGGSFPGDPVKSKGLQTVTDARFFGISTVLKTPVTDAQKELVIQFSVKHEQQLMPTCGGGYIKLAPLSPQETFSNDSPYLIAFGPDICGTQTRHILLTLGALGEDGRHYYFTRHHENRCETDRLTHTYTLVFRGDGTRLHEFEIYADGEMKDTGTLNLNGNEWMCTNRTSRRISWKQWKIEMLGFELWQVKAGSIFDNILITDSLEYANEFRLANFPAEAQQAEAAQAKLLEEKSQQEHQEVTKRVEEQRTKQDAEMAQLRATGSNTDAFEQDGELIANTNSVKPKQAAKADDEL